jgi:hypothetical protein
MVCGAQSSIASHKFHNCAEIGPRLGSWLAARLPARVDKETVFLRAVSDPGETVGMVRTVTDPDNRRAELAILVRTDLKGTGLGNVLMNKITRYHCVRHTGEIGAQILAENGPMLNLRTNGALSLTPVQNRTWLSAFCGSTRCMAGISLEE